jgi:hypothetical protein
LLAVGLVCNLLIKPVNPKYFMTPEELDIEKKLAHERAIQSETGPSQQDEHVSSPLWVYVAWAAVGVPLAWGIYRTAISVSKFFN